MKRQLKQLAEAWTGCARCELHKERPTDDIVFAWGKGSARFMVIYDAPTANDELDASPMAGEEGARLGQLLDEAGITLDDVFITPVVGCRPTRPIPATAEREAFLLDREPTKEEIAACRPRVTELVYRVDPQLIFTLGNTAFRAMVKGADRQSATSLDKAVGELLVTRIPGRFIESVPYSVMPLFSVQQIINTPSSAEHGPWATTVKLLRKGREYAEWLNRSTQRDAEALGVRGEGGGEEGKLRRVARLKGPK